jgi:hypothetical protein
MVRVAVLLVCTAAPALAQRFSIGVKAGIPLTDYLQTSGLYSSKTNRYTLGLAVDIRLRKGLSVEAGALYRRLHYTFAFPGVGPGGGEALYKTTANRWEFPIALKYRLPRGAFLSGGASVTHISGADLRQHSCSTGSFRGATPPWSCFYRSTEDPFLERRTRPGYVAGAGIELRATGRLRMVPEFRYTRWVRYTFRYLDQLTSHLHQPEVLLGLWF